MNIKIGDKVRFNQKGLDTLDTNQNRDGWRGIGCVYVAKAKNLGTGTITRITKTREEDFLGIDFQNPDMPDFDWPAEMFEKVPGEGEKLEFTQEEKELLQELVQDKLKGYQELLDKLR